MQVLILPGTPFLVMMEITVNNLSWMFFWASVLPNISVALAVVSFLLLLLSIVAIGFHFDICDSIGTDYKRIVGYIDSIPDNDKHYSDKAKAAINRMTDYRSPLKYTRIGFFTFPLFFILWGASFLVPDKDTFYMIAASQTGEQVVKTPEFDKLRRVLNDKLDGVLKADQPAPENKQ